MTTTMPAPRQFPQLDTVRAIASIAVVATHTSFAAGLYTREGWGPAMQRLEVGVAIFFVLSGFLLSRPYLLSSRGGPAHDTLGDYALKRIGRILPVYLVVVIAAFVLLPANHGLGVDRWILNLTLTDYFVSQQLPAGLTQMWSLSVEASFYLVLPALGVLLLARWRTRAVFAALGTLIAAGAVYLGVTTALDAGWMARWLPSYLGWFCLGIVLALAEVDSGGSALARRIRRIGADRAACWGLALAVFVLVSTPLGGSPLLVDHSASEMLIRHVSYGLIAVAFVAPCVFVDRGTVTRLMSHPAARHLGYVSYSLFCCHVILLELVMELLGYQLFTAPALTLFLIVLTVSLVVSELLYRGIERPVIGWVHRRVRRERATPPSATNIAS